MKHLITLTLLLAICPILIAEEPIRERIEWMDIWITGADKNDQPRVLFVGDSITRGYFGAAEKQLAGKASCARLTTSKCVCDSTFNDDLQLILKQYTFSVIHFNNGLHGWGYTEEQYHNGLLNTLSAIRELAPDAKLIWAATTPVRDKADLQKFGPETERVIERNRLAGEIMKELQIPTDDLFELVKDHPEWQSPDGVHFNVSGNEALGKQVGEIVSQQLPAKGS